MITQSKLTEWWRRVAVGASLFALLSNSFSTFGQTATTSKVDHLKTATPINTITYPFALRGPQLPYDSYTGDTTHRLFEMWQQSDCNITNATRRTILGV